MSTFPPEPTNVPPRGIKLIIVRAGAHRVLVPLANVSETMRPLPIQLLREAPPFVLGIAIIRGASVPVVDLGALLGRDEAAPPLFQRFLCLKLAGRAVALAVDAVLHIIEYPADQLDSLPPLLEQAASGIIERLCMADAELHMMLSSSKLLEATSLTPEAAAK